MTPVPNRLRSLRTLLTPSGGLATKTVRSGVWLTATNVVVRGLELVSLLVLARILSPADFGLIGIALLVLTALDQFSNLGLGAALIQHRADNVDRYLDTTWTLQIVRGVLLAGITYVLAAPAARFFAAPEVEPIIQVIAVLPLLIGLRNPGVVYFQKDLQFHRQFTYLVTNSVVYFVVTVTLAVLWGSVWALVFGNIAARVSDMLASYLLHDYRPRPRIDVDAVRELVGFGKWVTASGIIYFFTDEGDDFVVGWLLGAASLGLYRLAYRVALAPATELTNVVSTVMFPAYSKLKGNVGDVRAAFLRTIQLTTAVSVPASVGVIVVAPLFVETVLGTQWVEMTVALQILSLYGLFLSLSSSFTPVWLAMGKPDYTAKIGGLRVVAMALVIVPATTEFGIEGAAAAAGAAYVIVGLPLELYLATRLLDFSLAGFARELAYPLAAAAAMAAVVLTARSAVETGFPTLDLALLILLGVAVYAAVALLFIKRLGWRLERNVRELVTAFSG